MTVAVIWILMQMEAPWWCFAATVTMFFFKILCFLAAYGDKNGK